MLLAINTATSHLAIAAVDEGRILAEAAQHVGAEHSEAVFGLLDAVVGWSGRLRTDITALAVASGPGGFTGLRTGLAVAKTVAQVLDVPVYGVDTLSAIAHQFPGPWRVSAMLDGRLGKVYAGLYDAGDDRLKTLVPAALVPLDDWLAEMAAHPGPIAFVGEGATTYRDRLTDAARGWWVPPDAQMAASAVSVALLAERKLKDGAPDERETLAPVYHREPQAVVNWEAAQRAKQEGA